MTQRDPGLDRWASVPGLGAAELLEVLHDSGVSRNVVWARVRQLRIESKPGKARALAMTWNQLTTAASEWRTTAAVIGISEVLSPDGAPDFEQRDELTVKEVAEMLDLAPRSVTDLLSRGSLPGRKVGRSWLVSRTAVVARRDAA